MGTNIMMFTKMILFAAVLPFARVRGQTLDKIYGNEFAIVAVVNYEPASCEPIRDKKICGITYDGEHGDFVFFRTSMSEEIKIKRGHFLDCLKHGWIRRGRGRRRRLIDHLYDEILASQ